ncbi:uncharacterized protein LOC117828746 [Notolabrus celidotus]|uniref:uncharacterized protein LOC117828746 n=1 Tax=Notolabrus celidotus TaxID=1203425 RepID=UPI00148FD872|nr:uncharacterized protein LOC117828746 [Notolabrus celidotus]
MLQSEISDDDMDLLRNAFRVSFGPEDWTVTYPPQWKQQDSVNCGVFVCSAAENEVLHHEVTGEALTLSQCRTLRLHHATDMLKDVKAEDFPPTLEEIVKIEKKESKLQEAEAKRPHSSSHCLAWKIKTCLFQRATGTTSVLHDHIKHYPWVQCTKCKNWLHFQCAGVEGDWTNKDFFCGCDLIPDGDLNLESVKAEDILTDGEIKDLERNLQSGHFLSNRMYLWKHRGIDPALRKHYSEHVTLFNDMEENTIVTDTMAAAEWCRNTTFEGGVKFPVVLSMDEEEQTQMLQDLRSSEGDPDEDSPIELWTFVFERKNDHEKFCAELMDIKKYKVFSKFEKQ